MRKWLIMGLALAFPTVAFAQSDTPGPDIKQLRACSGSPTGNYFFSTSEWLRRIPHNLFKSGKNVSTPGSVANLRGLNDGTCDFGDTQGDVLTGFFVENPASRDNLSIFKVMYREYTHIICPAAIKANTLTEFAKLPGNKTMIVGDDGSGTASTWRTLRQVDDKLYGPIQRSNDPADITSATTVMDSTNTCMLWVSGLNSGDMVAANQRSIQTQNGKPGLKLLSVDDKRFLKLTGVDGQPLYKLQTITPHAPQNGQPGLYDHLINNGGFFSSASIEVLSMPSYLMVNNTYKNALGRATVSRLTDALVDSLPTVWARVNPAGQND